MHNDRKSEFDVPFSYYKYMGSMTSPPCEENVVWFIVDNPVG
tara:strand:+ start:393 stop:518 length:126 start_codon:yes stop_codon:yes gene_type:complete